MSEDVACVLCGAWVQDGHGGDVQVWSSDETWTPARACSRCLERLRRDGSKRVFVGEEVYIVRVQPSEQKPA